ncbi:unnamed protein product [Porites lobata]|uniref:Thymocyte nuclear protein 1 n=1 Tax=Porites lobata TaxID=104759 RepID=A0ABN8N8E2_9CNID|nr:unnamed protein product [Porites lobata]
MPPKGKRKAKTTLDDKPGKKKKQENQSTSKAKASKQQVQYTRWLIKSEPESRIEKGVDVKFGIDDLQKEPDQTTGWDGVRNYQARNFMRDQMKKGQLAFFYHSNCKTPGIAGIAEIVKEGYVDDTQFDKTDIHYDPSAKEDNPRWYMVDIKFVREMKRYISLRELKELHQEHKVSGGPLKSIALFTSARLSVQPVTEDEFDYICSLEDKKP